MGEVERVGADAGAGNMEPGAGGLQRRTAMVVASSGEGIIKVNNSIRPLSFWGGQTLFPGGGGLATTERARRAWITSQMNGDVVLVKQESREMTHKHNEQGRE